MDRRASVTGAAIAIAIAAAAICAATAACGGATSGVMLPADARVLARGSLAYAARASATAIVTIELEERFALVVRDPHSGRERTRVDLGPAERDVVALAVSGRLAWVGGDDRRVRTIDLEHGAVVATWPAADDITALRWLSGGWLAIGLASGVVCLRRVADGALVQCAALTATPIAALEGGGGLSVATSGGRTTWTVPALAATTPAPARRWRGHPVSVAGREVRAGNRLIARLGERVRSVEVGPRGELIIAAWVARLDDPSVIVLPR